MARGPTASGDRAGYVMDPHRLILSADEMSEVDRETQERYGIDGSILMENAGRGVADRVRERVPSGTVVCVAGPGHNGGDALVVARNLHLSGGYRVRIVLLRPVTKDLPRQQVFRLEALSLPRWVWTEDPDGTDAVLRSADCIVEGVSGTGLSGALREPAAGLVAAINGAGPPVLSIDVPSGARIGMAPEEPLINARWTVVTGNAKDFLFSARVRASAGEITLIDPGFPPELVQEIGTRKRRIRFGIPGRLMAIDAEAHKVRRGRLLVIGGSGGAAGAAILAAEAALHAGAGMVRLVSEVKTVEAALIREPAILGDVIPTGEDNDRWEVLFDWADGIVLGPGWIGAEEGEISSVLDRAAARGLPVVADAAALRISATRWASLDSQWASEKLVLTPHPGEMAGLLGADTPEISIAADPYAATDRFRERCPATVVLKDAVTIIAGPETVVIDGREPALGTAGSGDVLSGVIGAYLVQGNRPERAAEAGVFAHLEAGRRLARRNGWFSASELAREISRAKGIANNVGESQ